MKKYVSILVVGSLLFSYEAQAIRVVRPFLKFGVAGWVGALINEYLLAVDSAKSSRQAQAYEEYMKDRPKLVAVCTKDDLGVEGDKVIKTMESDPYISNLPMLSWLNFQGLVALRELRKMRNTNPWLVLILGKKDELKKSDSVNQEGSSNIPSLVQEDLTK